MHMSQCYCGHHKFAKLIMALGGISVLGFWAATFSGGGFLSISSDHYLKEFVIFALILISMHHGCNCCCGGCGDCTVKGMDGGMGGKSM